MARGSSSPKEAKPHYHGHRQRFRQEALERGTETLSDTDLLEGLLFVASARGDTRPLAKRLLTEFKTLAGVIAASPAALMKVDGMGPTGAVQIKLVAETQKRAALQAIPTDDTVLSNWDRLINYCHVALAHERVENFHVLYLNNRNRLIRDERQQRGTVNATTAYPREVLKRALELDASALILVHNHPGGDPTPSTADVTLTREIRDAAQKLHIRLHDHVIVTDRGHVSMKAEGYF